MEELEAKGKEVGRVRGKEKAPVPATTSMATATDHKLHKALVHVRLTPLEAYRCHWL